MQGRPADDHTLRPIGHIRSMLRAPDEAPRQGSEGAPDAWLELIPIFVRGLSGIAARDEVIVLTWLHRAERDVLDVHPRGDPKIPLTGVFATRSPRRPNPIGLHRVTVREISGTRLRIGPIEAIEGTPVIDIKPVLAAGADFIAAARPRLLEEQPTMKAVSRYHPLLVTLHWLLAVLIVAALAVGFFGLAAMSNADPRKIAVLRLHMAGGMLILALMVVRLVVRLRTPRPAPATTGHAMLDRLAPMTHWGFYLVVLAMVGTGYATGILAGLPAIVFAGSGDPLPLSFAIYPTFVAHGYLAALLAGLIALHLLAALYHHFVRKDGLLRRMSFARRVTIPRTAAE